MKTNNSILLAITAVAIIFTSPYAALASANDDAARELYEQLVEQEQDTATTYLEDTEDRAEVIGKLVGIDDEENMYDGPVTIYKAPSYKVSTYNTGKMEVSLNNNYSRDESEDTLNKMIAEIDETLPENASKEETLKAIIKYINRTYKYDTDSKNIEDYQNYIQAYNGNRKILCDQYSIVTLFLCTKYGIDCKIIEGNNHLFNLIRTAENESYRAYDLSKTSYHLPAKVGYVDQLTGTYAVPYSADAYEKAVARVINIGPYKLSFTIEEIIAIIAIAGIIALIVKAFDIRTTRRNAKHVTSKKRHPSK